MTRGPTSRVTISSTSPLLILRLFFQPRYSTFSTVTDTAARPFSAVAAGGARRPRATAAVNDAPRANVGCGRTVMVLRFGLIIVRFDPAPYSARPTATGQEGAPRPAGSGVLQGPCRSLCP